MKILFVTNGYPTSKHPEYCVFTKEQIESLSRYSEIQSDIYFINAREKGKMEYVRSIPRLFGLIRNYDIIHAFHGLAFILVFVLCPRKKIVVSFLNSIDNEYGEGGIFSKVLVWITKIIIKKNNITKIFKDKIPQHVSTNCYYLPNGVDLSKFYPITKSEAKNKLLLADNKRYILFVSSKSMYRKQKRYDIFYNIMKRLKEEFADVEELLLVGEPRDKIIYYFNSADLHLLTSDYEGSPNSVKEALACSIPVITTPVGNVSDILEDVPNCQVASSFEEDELYNLTKSFLVKVPKRVDLRQYLILKKFDMESKARELYAIYKSL